MYYFYENVIQYNYKKVVTNMKKIIPALALVGGVAAFVIYKMKKEEQKQIIDLDQGLLHDEDLTDDEIEEGPISNPTACCEDSLDGIKECAHEVSEDVQEHITEFMDDTKKKIHSVKSEVQENADEVVDKAKHLVHVELDQIREKTADIIEQMQIDGDIHEHERPVQHLVKFECVEDLEAFKSVVINKGFVVTNGNHDLTLNILHISPISEDKLMANIEFIAGTAKEHHGIYDGWTSKVVY